MTFDVRIARLAALCIIATASFSTGQSEAGQEHEQMRIEGEVRKPYIVRLETTQHKQYCQATTSIEYIQNNAVASVSGKIENEDCPASSGTYTISIRFRDGDGVVHDLDVEEPWQRDDDQPVEFAREYEIGRNADLVRVRVRRMKCLCADIQATNDDIGTVQGKKAE